MTLTAIATIIKSLSVIYIEQQELALIGKLNNFFDFDHNIFLLEKSVDLNRFIDTREEVSTPRSVYTFQYTDDNTIKFENLKEIKSKKPFLIVAPVHGTFEHSLSLLIQVKKVQRLHINTKIGVFFSVHIPKDDIQKFFEWFWKHQIINIFAVLKYHELCNERGFENLLNILTYTPFGRFHVISRYISLNVTEIDELESLFLKQNSNFHQHPIRLGRQYKSGADEKLLLSLLGVLNASHEIIGDQLPINQRSGLFDNGTIDMVISLYKDDQHARINLYPLIMESYVFLVPEALPYPEFSAYLRSVTSDFFFAYLLIAITAFILMLSLFRYVKQKKILFFRSVADVLNLLTNDNGFIKYQLLSRSEVFLIVPLTFAGCVIVNGILSTLQSYVTRPIIQPQIDTIEDIFMSPFPIFALYENFAIHTSSVLYDLSMYNWTGRILAGDGEIFNQIDVYNTSMSFITRQFHANIVLDVQKGLKVKGYHIPDMHVENYVASYPVSDDFPFIERFNEIIHWIRSAGLYDKWMQDVIGEVVNYILKNRDFLLKRDETVIESSSMPMFIVYGWFAGVMVLVIEVIWKKFKLSLILNRELEMNS